ncbi:MAG: hypothetical protein WA322_05905 [Pseudolabrys sp.]
MKIATKFIFATVLTFSAVAPTFAHAAYLQNTSQIRTTNAPAQHKSVRAVRGLDAMAYVPADVSDRYSRDFGIGSQR